MLPKMASQSAAHSHRFVISMHPLPSKKKRGHIAGRKALSTGPLSEGERTQKEACSGTENAARSYQPASGHVTHRQTHTCTSPHTSGALTHAEAAARRANELVASLRATVQQYVGMCTLNHEAAADGGVSAEREDVARREAAADERHRRLETQLATRDAEIQAVRSQLAEADAVRIEKWVNDAVGRGAQVLCERRRHQPSCKYSK